VGNININLGETEYRGVDWIKIDQDRIQRRGVVKNVMNHLVLQKEVS
jgi:hypothetical protein